MASCRASVLRSKLQGQGHLPALAYRADHISCSPGCADRGCSCHAWFVVEGSGAQSMTGVSWYQIDGPVSTSKLVDREVWSRPAGGD
jgi:hypothetical protein